MMDGWWMNDFWSERTLWIPSRPVARYLNVFIIILWHLCIYKLRSFSVLARGNAPLYTTGNVLGWQKALQFFDFSYANKLNNAMTVELDCCYWQQGSRRNPFRAENIHSGSQWHADSLLPQRAVEIPSFLCYNKQIHESGKKKNPWLWLPVWFTSLPVLYADTVHQHIYTEPTKSFACRPI